MQSGVALRSQAGETAAVGVLKSKLFRPLRPDATLAASGLSGERCARAGSTRSDIIAKTGCAHAAVYLMQHSSKRSLFFFFYTADDTLSTPCYSPKALAMVRPTSAADTLKSSEPKMDCSPASAPSNATNDTAAIGTILAEATRMPR